MLILRNTFACRYLQENRFGRIASNSVFASSARVIGFLSLHNYQYFLAHQRQEHLTIEWAS
jgi:hypothetical protein